MGWKASLIIIEEKNNTATDEAILKAIGKTNYLANGSSYLEACMYPTDQSISIGRYRGNIIICDGNEVSMHTLENSQGLQLAKEEQALVDLFPKSEILTVACHSVVNFHGYSLIANGVKKRLKLIDSDTPKIAYGEPLEEEQLLYDTANLQNGSYVWKYEDDPEEELTEDALMEDFTFGVAKRRLGVLLDGEDGDELMETIVFNRYQKSQNAEETNTATSKKTIWYKIAIYVLIFIAWRVLKRWLFAT